MNGIVILSYRPTDMLFDVEAHNINGDLCLLEVFAASQQEAEEKAETSGYEVYRPRIVTRPGDMAAIYAEETGVNFATALIHCNME